MNLDPSEAGLPLNNNHAVSMAYWTTTCVRNVLCEVLLLCAGKLG